MSCSGNVAELAQGRARTEGWASSARPPVCFGGAVRALPGQRDRAKKNRLAGQVPAGQVAND